MGSRTELSAQVVRARRELADRIDPDPPPRRRGRRLLTLGLLFTAVSAVLWALLERRARAAEDAPRIPGDDQPIRATPPGSTAFAASAPAPAGAGRNGRS